MLCKIRGFHSGWLWRLSSSGMWRRVDLVIADVWEERYSSIFGVRRISEWANLRRGVTIRPRRLWSCVGRLRVCHAQIASQTLFVVGDIPQRDDLRSFHIRRRRHDHIWDVSYSTALKQPVAIHNAVHKSCCRSLQIPAEVPEWSIAQSTIHHRQCHWTNINILCYYHYR
jgi:hypothetical protein